MTPEQITALAREYAEEIHEATSESFKDEVMCEEIENAESFLRFILHDYYLVEKSEAAKLCRLTLEHDDSVDYGLIDGLTDIVLEVFPEQYHQVAEELSNPEIAKEVEE